MQTENERIARLECELVALVRLMDTKIEERDKALQVHENQLSNHLDMLNHYKSEAIAKEKEFVTHAQFDLLMERVSELRLDFNNFKSSSVGIVIGATTASAALGGLITGLVLRLLK